MNARWGLVLVLAVAWAGPARAQSNWQFRWQPGQVLSYQVKHVTTVTEAVEGTSVETVSKLDLVKRWQVLDVDARGVATLQLSLAAMRNEQKRPNGETIVFDSEKPDQSTPWLHEQMAKYVGKTLAVLRVDGYGRVVEVKQGEAARYEAEPPFALVLPEGTPEAGQGWVQPFTVVLAPPQGTGEKYEVRQKYQCVKVADGQATVDVKAEYQTPPQSVQERLPLLQKEVEGQAVFDVRAGRLVSARLNIDRTVEGHQGPGSSYRFQSRYVEELRP